MDPTQLLDEKIIGGGVVALLFIAGLVVKLTKTKKDDKFIEKLKDKSGMFAGILAKIGQILLSSRKKDNGKKK